MGKLAKIIQEHKGYSIVSLDLSNNSLGDDEIKFILVELKNKKSLIDNHFKMKYSKIGFSPKDIFYFLNDLFYSISYWILDGSDYWIFPEKSQHFFISLQ